MTENIMRSMSNFVKCEVRRFKPKYNSGRDEAIAQGKKKLKGSQYSASVYLEIEKNRDPSPDVSARESNRNWVTRRQTIGAIPQLFLPCIETKIMRYYRWQFVPDLNNGRGLRKGLRGTLFSLRSVKT